MHLGNFRMMVLYKAIVFRVFVFLSSCQQLAGVKYAASEQGIGFQIINLGIREKHSAYNI